MKNLRIYLGVIILSMFSYSCVFDDVDPNDPIPDYPPIGGYASSDDIQSSNLVAKLSFESNITDTKGGLTSGTSTGITYGTGVKGNAYVGSTSGLIYFDNVSSAITGIQSMTISMWVKTVQHTGGAQCLFMFQKEGSFWGNAFTLIEGTTTDQMTLKNHIEKNVTPAITNAEQWMVHSGDYALAGMYGDWKHMVWTYDGNTSKYRLYIDGEDVTPTSMVNRYANSSNDPLGVLAFVNFNKMIIGGYQQSLPGGTPDSWMLNYTGSMDEFRIYNIALSADDVKSLYKLEKAGR